MISCIISMTMVLVTGNNVANLNQDTTTHE